VWTADRRSPRHRGHNSRGCLIAPRIRRDTVVLIYEDDVGSDAAGDAQRDGGTGLGARCHTDRTEANSCRRLTGTRRRDADMQTQGPVTAWCGRMRGLLRLQVDRIGIAGQKFGAGLAGTGLALHWSKATRASGPSGRRPSSRIGARRTARQGSARAASVVMRVWSADAIGTAVPFPGAEHQALDGRRRTDRLVAGWVGMRHRGPLGAG